MKVQILQKPTLRAYYQAVDSNVAALLIAKKLPSEPKKSSYHFEEVLK